MNAFTFLDESFSIRFMQTLLHFLWQGTCIAIIAFSLDGILRQNAARTKYMLHVVAMLAMVLCLPITFAVVDSPSPAFDISDPARTPRSPALTAGSFDSSNALNNSFESVQDSPTSRSNPTVVRSTSLEDSVISPVAKDSISEGQVELSERVLPTQAENEQQLGRQQATLTFVAPVLTLSYFACVVGMIARLMVGVWGGHHLRQSAIEVTDSKLLARLARQAERIGLRLAPTLTYCEQISVPVVVGILRPAIVLPASLASGLAPDQLDSLISHELAHIRRYDPVVNLLQRTVEAIIFFHPAVWYVSRRIDVERENAADDLVVTAGWQRVAYADALVRMAELSDVLRSRRSTPDAAMLAATGGNQSDFKRRIMRLLEHEPSHVRLTRSGVTMLLAAIIVLTVTPLAVQMWAQQIPDMSVDSEIEASDDEQRLGRSIENFTLLDYLGTEYSLGDFSEANIVVVAFLGTECPLAKLYGPQLAALSSTYEKRGVQFIGINANQQDTPSEMGHYARRHGITFPLLKDPGNQVADQFRAERTPEVFLLDKQRVVRYWGRIDDQFGVGYARPKVSKNYLVAAIDELLAGKSVSVPETESVGCHIGRVSRVPPTGEITYTKQISRVMQKRCVECHREGGIAPFALDSYEEVAAWAETISEVVEDQRMPPWHANPQFGHFANDGRMPEAEKELLHRWVENGVPVGSRDDLPGRRQFVDGWALGTPDLVLTMPEAITVQPTGVVDYQYVTVDPHFTEGKWIRASEIRPGVRSVVHHIIVFINPPGGDPILKERGVGFETVGSYEPGSPPMELPEGVARYVPAGSTLVFQIHYTPDGKEQHDQSEVGLYFADPKTVQRTMQTGVAANLEFVIPPRARNHRVEATHRFSHDMELHALAPHMHYRGKAFRFEATYPNGSREILLDVPKYDFNWQNVYRFAKTKFMPEGTLLKCVAYFDNSERNLSNPDPTETVRWGEQTWDEMMIGYFEGVFLNQDLSLPELQINPADGGTYRVRFTYKPDRPARNIHLAGTFNDWSNTKHALIDEDGDGIYHTDAIVNAGEHRYKFVIDGNYWTHDPASRILTGFLHESFFVAGPGSNLKPSE